MTANATNTWEIQLVDGGAHRPSLDDMGGAELEDDDEFPPPRDGTQPYADLLNQLQLQGAAQGRTASPCQLTIDFSAGSPFIDRIQTCSSLLSAGDFTLTRTAGGAGAGDITIDWLTWKLPPQVIEPGVTINDLTKLTANAPLVHNVTSGVTAGHSQIRVVTPLAGTQTDMRFTVRF